MPRRKREGNISTVMPSNPPRLTANVPRSHSDALATHWYGWFFVVSSMLWPRLCLLGFWIFGSFMADAFDHSWVLQVAGFLVLPWTTMVYALMWGAASDGVVGWEWGCVAAAVLLDLLTWGEARRLRRGLRRG
jgi:hypothetical protein